MTNRNALYIGEILVNIDTEWSSGDYTANVVQRPRLRPRRAWLRD
jgi:hypothetical protein